MLYVGNPCPWCHRVVLTLVLRGLTRHISIVNAVDDPERASRGGWVFNSPEPVFGCNDLRCASCNICIKDGQVWSGPACNERELEIRQCLLFPMQSAHLLHVVFSSWSSERTSQNWTRKRCQPCAHRQQHLALARLRYLQAGLYPHDSSCWSFCLDCHLTIIREGEGELTARAVIIVVVEESCLKSSNTRPQAGSSRGSAGFT